MKKLVLYLIVVLTFLLFITLGNMAVAYEDTYNIGYQTYVYAYPLVLMKATQISQNMPENKFIHYRILADPSKREVVRPNLDNLYSIAWINLSEGPVILTIPETLDYYYLVQMMDMWTDTYASPGSRTIGSNGGQFMVVGPDWDSQSLSFSPDLQKIIENYGVIKSPTKQVWILLRIEVDNKKNYSTIHKIQDGFNIRQITEEKDAPGIPMITTKPNPHYLKISNTIIERKMDPSQVVAEMDAADFLETFAQLMIENPPHVQDWPIVTLMRKIGIIPGKPFDFNSLEQNIRESLKLANQDAITTIQKYNPMHTVDNWNFSTLAMGSYGTSYMFRAAVALRGLGANLPEDAVYPMTDIDCNGELLDGSKNYIVHFDKNMTQPENAFWSITIYDTLGYLIENPLNRYSLNSKQNEMKLNQDGSLDIYLQNLSPGIEWESNWLPIPSVGQFNVTIRIYWPKQEVLEGTWRLPKVCPR